MQVTLYHNPRCSKSRQALQLLRERGIEPVLIDYLEQPPAPAELDRLLTMLGVEPRELMRKHEAPYKDNRLDDPGLDRQALIQALHDHPILIERPIAVVDGKAVVGRPPENILSLL